MRILLDQSVHDHRNQGNNSLLQVAIQRFKRQWPDASFEVISNSPHLCRVYFPDSKPVSPDYLLGFEGKVDSLHRIVPNQLWRSLFEIRETLNSRTNLISKLRDFHSPNGIENDHGNSDHGAINQENSNASEDYVVVAQPSIDPYYRIADYDLYCATGGGYMCDSDKERLMQVFNRIESAIAHGVPVVMVGQGVGPLEESELLQRAAAVLPELDYLFIREESNARPLLDSLCVPSSKVLMTGDDAIELAYRARKDPPGRGIGISLRVASYTGLNQLHIEAIRPIVIEKARKYRAELIAAPIDVNDTDKHFTEQLMEGYSASSSSWRKYETPAEIIERISQCRIMISGTFHGAVFALGQGIPVIGLAITDEYYKKLSGLTAEFGKEGCQIIHLGEHDKEKKLAEAIDLAWNSADILRPELLENAKRQIDLGYAAYDRIFKLVEERNRTKQFA